MLPDVPQVDAYTTVGYAVPYTAKAHTDHEDETAKGGPAARIARALEPVEPISRLPVPLSFKSEETSFIGDETSTLFPYLFGLRGSKFILK